MARQLGPGDQFPEYLIPVVGDRSLQLLTDLRGDYAVILFYRGIW
jgi:peroxiredoxin